MTLAEKMSFRPTPVFRARRRRALLRVRMEDGDGAPRDVMVQDISASGIRAAARGEAPAPGEVVTLHLPDGRELWGVVRWVQGKQFGVEFDTSACPETVQTGNGALVVTSGQ